MWRKLSLVCVGMITVFVIIIATSVVHAQSPVTPNLDAYCKSLGYVGFKQDPTQPNNPYGGGCLRADGTMVGIDMQAACRWQFGDVYPIAQYPDPMQPGWLCYPNNNTAPKPPPPMTPMSPTVVPQQQSGGNSGGNQNPPPNTGPLHPDMQEPGGPGVKVPYGCGYDGHGWGTNQNQANAYDWRCPDGYLLGATDFQRFCQYAWGSLYPYVTLADWRNKYGWQCSAQPGYIDPYGGNNGGDNSGQQTSGNTSCSSAQSRLSSGDIAWVSDADPYPLLVFDQPGRGTNQLFTVPIRQSVSIISGPVCKDNATWVQIRYNGNVGWAAEANHYGNYNLIPGTWGGGSSGGSGNAPYSGTLTASAAWYKSWMAHEHIACAVFAVPNDVYHSNPSYSAWFKASDGTRITAGYYAAGSGLENQFHISTPSNTMLYGVCISGRYFLANPWAGPWYGSEFADPNHWYLAIN